MNPQDERLMATRTTTSNEASLPADATQDRKKPWPVPELDVITGADWTAPAEPVADENGASAESPTGEDAAPAKSPEDDE